jgi:lipopolysaccharide export system protein LptA
MTPRFSACVALLALVAIGLPGRSGGQDGRAATEARPAEDGSAPSQGSFLDAMSFSSSREPISVSADSLVFDYRTRVLTYKGGVVVTQGDMKLQSDMLTVTLDDHTENRLKGVVADGQVRLSKGSRWATGGRAVFDRTQNTVVLSQDAMLHDGPNEVSGSRIVVYLDQQRSVVEGGNGRVKALLFPPSGSATPAGGNGRRE